MKTFNKIGIAAAIILGGAVSNASALTVSGVTWNPDDGSDMTANGNVYEIPTGTVGETISGYGRIDVFNNDPASTFCASGCELTYEFGGFQLLDTNPADSDGDGNAYNDTGYAGIDPATGFFAFTGGWVNVYVGTDNSLDFDVNDPRLADAIDGILFLSLVADDPLGNGVTLSGNVNPIALALGTLSGSGSAFLDVAYAGDLRNPETAGGSEGTANVNFDTDNVGDVIGIPGLDNDIYFNSNFVADPICANIPECTHRGSADIRGDSVPVPAPLALLGLGLLGLGLVRRKA